jgi:hypothetical protein
MKLDERKKATDFDATQKLLAKYEKVAQKVQLWRPYFPEIHFAVY